MKKILLSMIAALCLSASAFAQAHSDRITLGVGLLYENGLDATQVPAGGTTALGA